MPTTTVTGEVERVTYENEETGFRVIRVGSVSGRGQVSVVGRFPAVGPGTRVRVTGDLIRDPTYGEQLRVETLVPIDPDTLPGLERYLGSGLIPGVGAGFARRIVKTFGLDTLRVLDEQPERLGEVPGLGSQRATEIRRAWSSQRAQNSALLVLQTHGISGALAARILERYGNRAVSIVEQHPYRLALEVRGVGFKTADRVAQSLGIRGDHPERAQAGVVHVLEELAEQGHVACPRADLTERTAEMLAVDAAHVEAAIDALWAAGRIVIEDSLVYLSRLHASEAAVAGALGQLRTAARHVLPGVPAAIEAFESRSKVVLAAGQRRAVEAVAEDKIVVVTGGPGVGKTTLVRALIAVLSRAKLEVRLAAPTGRAAKRLSEATGREATTIHRLLEYDPRLRQFARNAARPIDADALIVDEASMIDVELAAALLTAVAPAARLVIVGDADQLPSVGPGAVLRDIIDSRAVPVVRLEEIFRQAHGSGIVKSAHAILRGELPAYDAGASDTVTDFYVIPRREPEEAAKVVEELVTRRIPRRFGLDPLRDVQVLSPMHRGAAGTTALNETLQRALNPRGAEIERRGQRFRVGDRVMQTKNDYERDVYNGDLGWVTAADPRDRRLTVRFDEREVIYDDADLDTLTLAYATSIHKSQGSEYPAVVIPLLTTHFVMLSVHLLYTAVTRAKQLCCLVADPRALHLCLAANRREERMTRLAERLRVL